MQGLRDNLQRCLGMEVEIIHGQIVAKANGYESVEDMAEKTIGQAKFNEMFGGVPEWIRTDAEGNFIFVGMNPMLFN